ncbi:hypothetical protein Ddc_16538 [Ditylenchus destructor]|nr:hypothetical protein Ddc_16538 [Ditylenchus destructor]
MDNGTLLEAFKFLNYMQLAKSSRVSKRFRDLIRTNRHRLALLLVTKLCMNHPKRPIHVFGFKTIVFGKELSPEEYNEWVIHNGYSKQIPLEGRDAGSMQYEREPYELKAEVDDKDPTHGTVSSEIIAFNACMNVNNESWPLFEHFVRLLTAPFIYIRSLELISQSDVLNLLPGAIVPEQLYRLQCGELKFTIESNKLKFFKWIKNNVQCDEYKIVHNRHLAHYDENILDEVFFNFLLTGAQCTSVIKITYPDPSKVIAGFVQKFIDLKNCDEYQFVESIEFNVMYAPSADELKSKYAKFLVKEEHIDNHRTDHTFEFINNDVGKKLQLTAKIFDNPQHSLSNIYASYFVLQIKNLISNIATMDNGTMVEAFKYLKYCQLAKNQLVSKRFGDLIQTHRHSLALLDVDEISMKRISLSPFSNVRRHAHIFVFGKMLSADEYNEWVIRNQYSKEAPLEGQVAMTDSMQNDDGDYDGYEFSAYGVVKATNWRNLRTSVFKASAELNHEYFPLFQHFVRLITDPFVYIRWMDLIPQNDFFHLLVGAVNSDRERLQCGKLNFNLKFNLESNAQKFLSWIKNNVHCDVFDIFNCFCDEELPDFFLTGAHCTSKIYMNYLEPSKVITGFVQKFMGLKKCDEYQIVESIECYVQRRPYQELMGKCGKFIVKEENNHDSTEHFFEFVNNDIGEKFKLNVKIYDHTLLGYSNPHSSYFVLKIENM